MIASRSAEGPLVDAVLELAPQPGPQEDFLASPADIAIMGGAAGAGKTFGLLLEPIRHVGIPGFNCAIFRRTSKQITNPGGMWDESQDLYPYLGGEPVQSPTHRWDFPSGASVSFHHLQHEKDKFNWKGAQVALLGFDQLEEFTEGQFFYLLSRNRSTSGVRPYVRATCNPDPDSWLADFIGWWIDQDSGYPIPERSGVLRWFVRDGDEIVWGDRPEGMQGLVPGVRPKSVTFIPGTIHDNPILLERDPGYLAGLLSLATVERERLFGGNWKIRPTAGMVFNRAWFDFVEAPPVRAARVRYWDKAATEDGGAFSVGVLLARAEDGTYYVEDVERGQWTALQRERVIQQKAEADGVAVTIWVEQEPGSGGKESAQSTVRNLAGFKVYAERVTGDKVERAMPLAAQAEAGNVKLVRGPWNEAFLSELHRFPDGKYADQVDASAGAFNKLARRQSYDPADWATVRR